MDARFPNQPSGSRMGYPGFPVAGGQLPSWRDVSATDMNQPLHQPPLSVSMPPPGFPSSERCTDCFAVCAKLKDVTIERDEISKKYTSLIEEHQKCRIECDEISKNYASLLEEHRKCPIERDEIVKKYASLIEEHQKYRICEGVLKKSQKELDERSRKCVDPEKKLESIQEPAKPQLNLPPEIGEEIQASNSKSTVNQESVKPQEDVRNSKTQAKSSTRSVEASSYSKKRPEKRRDLVNESQKGEVVKENPSVGEDFNSARNTNKPTTKKREDDRQPKSMVTVKEIQGDLFQGTEDYSLAHCVGSDFIMSSGIAIIFRKQFRRTGELLEQNKVPGGVAVLQDRGRHIYYLVTKLFSTGKPTWDHFAEAVHNLRELCESHNVKQLAMPQIGCGLDLLQWSQVKALLMKEFAGTDIEIRVYWKEAEARTEKQRWNLKLFNNRGPLSQIDPQYCAIVFLASTDGHVTPQMEELDKRFRFLHHYKSASRAIGGLYVYQFQQYNLFGFMLKKNHGDEFSFSHFNDCLIKMKKLMKQGGLSYIGLEAFEDPKHMIIMHKIWTLMTEVYFIERFEVHFYWPDGVQEGWNEGLIT